MFFYCCYQPVFHVFKSKLEFHQDPKEEIFDDFGLINLKIKIDLLLILMKGVLSYLEHK